MKIISVNNMDVSLDKKKILSNINFDINKGEIVGLLGPNGAGKTTIMKAMCGLVPISDGDIVIHGQSIRNNIEDILGNVGVLIEDTCAYDNLSGYENLKILARMNKNCTSDDVDKVVQLVDLADSINNRFRTYSLGMKKRLGIAMALLKKPEILILDEPTNGLDIEGIYEIKKMLKQLVKEQSLSVFISSHLTEQLSELCDRALFIKKGKLLSDINMNVLQGEKLEQYYLKIMGGEKC